MTAPRRAASAARTGVAFAPDPARFHAQMGVPEPVAEPSARPWLRVVPEPASERARRLARLFTALAALAALFGLFGVVGVHVMLAQGQGDVQTLQQQVQEQEELQRRLRLEVAELEAPGRIVATARQQLGMVTPTTVVPIAPATLDAPPASILPAAPAAAAPANTASTTAGTTRP